MKKTQKLSGGNDVSLVKTPEMYIYKPQKSNNALSSAVLIMPGGGYKYLSMFNEGVEVANWFTERGIIAVVLKSRLPDDRLMTNKEKVPLTDANQALKILKNQAEKYGIDANNIGIMGFSAGGHLAASLATNFNEAEKPAFSILIYPVISMDSKLTHLGSRIALLGNDPSNDLVEKYSTENHITNKTPPTFLVHASDDSAVSYKNSLIYYENLISKGVKKCELHIFPSGGHGFWMADKIEGTVSKWPQLLETWLSENHWIK